MEHSYEMKTELNLLVRVVPVELKRKTQPH
jgi:hypothetical protein